jgi:hypothetical protein
MGFEILTPGTKKVMVFWVVTACSGRNTSPSFSGLMIKPNKKPDYTASDPRR